MMLEPTVLTVSQITTYIRSLLEGDAHLSSVYIAGEISNFKDHMSSGHWYFSLKDEYAVVRAVMFRSANQRLRFHPENGMHVIVRGRISVYDRDGAYQLYAENMQPDGVGAAALAFEQLRKKLEAEGLFRLDRKKPLPLCPAVVGVITSPTGAARRDIENVLARRFPLAEVRLAPVLVQGAQAPEQLAAAIRALNADGRAEVIILGRGGGAAEELAAFNDEQVVRAVANSRIPIISAVGHETDVTLCDFAADRRAPTPSAAAELAVPDQMELAARIAAAHSRLNQLMLRRLAAAEQQLDYGRARLAAVNPVRTLEQQEKRWNEGTARLEKQKWAKVDAAQLQLHRLIQRLDALSPTQVLMRGYAAVRGKTWITSAAQLAPKQAVTLHFADGQAHCEVKSVNRGGIDDGEKGNV